MMVRLYRFLSNRQVNHMDEGFSLVEAMISMVILTIAAAGIGYVLVSSNQQLATLGYVSQSQQCEMENVTAGVGSVPPCSSAASTTEPPIEVAIITGSTNSSVPIDIDSVRSSSPALPNNQQPPAWWQP